jgi:hypothetical protein
LEVDLEEGEMEVEVQSNAITSMNKVIFQEIALTQDDHGSLTAGIMPPQLKIA